MPSHLQLYIICLQVFNKEMKLEEMAIWYTLNHGADLLLMELEVFLDGDGSSTKHETKTDLIHSLLESLQKSLKAL